VSHSGDGGITFGEPQWVSSDRQAFLPDILAVPGKVIVTWMELDDSQGVEETVVRVSSNQGESFGEPITVPTNTYSKGGLLPNKGTWLPAQVVSGSTGDLYLAWPQPIPGQTMHQVQFQRVSIN